jgi:hypothetical protein
MAAMSTALTEFSVNGDSETYTTSGHSIEKPKIVISKRKVPQGTQTVSEYSVSVVHATENSDGDILPQKYSFQVISKGPIDGTTTDRDAALVIFRDIVASDEFGASVSSQNHVG